MQQMIRQLRGLPLTAQQKRTLKGQILAGDIEGAQKGIEKLTRRAEVTSYESPRSGNATERAKKGCRTREKAEKV